MDKYDDDDMDPTHILPSSGTNTTSKNVTILKIMAADALSHRQQVAKMRDEYR